MSDGRPLRDLSDDDLISAGAALETRHSELTAAFTVASGAVNADLRQLRIAGTKLGINGFLALAGIIGAPVTFGLSLLLTLASVGMILWDGVDFARTWEPPT